MPALAPMGVLLLALGCALAATYFVHVATVRLHERHFEEIVDEVRQTVVQRLDAYAGMLYATRGVVEAHGVRGERDAFATFVGSLDLARRLPGVQGVGYCERMDAAGRAEWTRALRAEGLDTFGVWPPLPPELGTGCPIVLLEPRDWRNARALGFDMMTEPTRRRAMETSRDTDSIVASQRVTLVQETSEDPQPGFLLYLPLYAPPHPASLDERRARWRGYVYSPFRALDLFSGISPPTARRKVDFEIYDGETLDSAHLLYDDDRRPHRDGDHPRLQRAVPIDVAGVRWTILFTTLAGFDADNPRGLDALVALVGVLISVLLYLIARAQALARLQAEAAEAQAAALAEAASQLGRSLDPQALLGHAAQLGAQLCADACDVLLVQPDGDAVWVRATRQEVSEPRLQRAEELPGRPTLEALLHRSRGALELGPEARPFTALLLEPPPAGTGRVLALPLQARGRVLGAMLLHQQGRTLAPSRRALCEELARLVAGALDNAQLYESAQEAVRVREEFLSIASHELKTPLTSLRLHMQSLKRALHPAAEQQPSPERMQRSIEIAERQSVRLNTLIESLLDLSRLTSGKIALEPERLDLSTLVREVSQRLAQEAAVAGCELVVKTDARPVEGVWDRLRLEQVVTNLLSNAIKYGAGKPVHVAVEEDGDRARLRVTDEGIGIPREALGRIFERFERAVSARHYGGLGLGLYIVRQIVEALGGRISVESTPNAGSTFVVELPREAQRSVSGDELRALH